MANATANTTNTSRCWRIGMQDAVDVDERRRMRSRWMGGGMSERKMSRRMEREIVAGLMRWGSIRCHGTVWRKWSASNGAIYSIDSANAAADAATDASRAVAVTQRRMFWRMLKMTGWRH